jgi:voltage-gated potassium channel
VPEERTDEVGRSWGRVSLPERERSYGWILGRRLLIAGAIVVGTVLVVYLDRRGYRDGNDPAGRVNLVDAFYYSMVTLSATGYGDIAPVAAHSRMINALVITAARIGFLIVLVGTTLEILASRGRELLRVSRWRKKMGHGHHIVVVGYGTKGRSAVETLVKNGHDREEFVIVDPTTAALQDAHSDGLAVVTGDATRRDVLVRAGVATAQQVIITTNRDDSNVLATLTVRQLNPDAWIVAAVREQENAPLVRQSGANAVITSSDAVGRLLGLSSLSPTLGQVMEDLLTHGEGLEVAERELLVGEVGKQPQSLPDQVIAVVRDEKVFRYFDPTVTQLARGDRLVVVRPARELPWAPRPGTHDEDFAVDQA